MSECPCVDDTPQICPKCGADVDKDACMLPVAAERQWIPVSERLPRPDIDSVYIWPRPDFGNEVHTGILTSTAEDAEIAWYASNYISGYGLELVKVKVTHWMPLPQPPEQEKG